jgi:hypothetical protein
MEKAAAANAEMLARKEGSKLLKDTEPLKRFPIHVRTAHPRECREVALRSTTHDTGGVPLRAGAGREGGYRGQGAADGGCGQPSGTAPAALRWGVLHEALTHASHTVVVAVARTHRAPRIGHHRSETPTNSAEEEAHDDVGRARTSDCPCGAMHGVARLQAALTPETCDTVLKFVNAESERAKAAVEAGEVEFGEYFGGVNCRGMNGLFGNRQDMFLPMSDPTVRDTNASSVGSSLESRASFFGLKRSPEWP